MFFSYIQAGCHIYWWNIKTNYGDCSYGV